MAIFISIHAPTRGATKKIKKAIIWYIISIHAPTRGATPQRFITRQRLQFQSTLLQEERRAVSFNSPTVLFISIHAPTRGATTLGLLAVFPSPYFNPRSYKRSDQLLRATSPMPLISIHAPTRGATEPFFIALRIALISIHAPTRGATLSGMYRIILNMEFQSTLLQEERPVNLTITL